MKAFVASRLGAMVAILVALTGVMFVLQHVSPLDPVSLLGAAALLALAAAAACYGPARRASRVDPASALRAE